MAETPQSSETAAEQPVPETAAGAPGPENTPVAEVAPQLSSGSAIPAEPQLPSVSPASPGPSADVSPTPEPSFSRPSAPASEPAPVSEPAPAEPEPTLAGVAATISVPALESATAEGGEWELLVSKVRAWLDGADLQARWNALGGPLRAFGLLLAAVVVLRLYGALIDTLGDLPLLPRLLQLAGLISLIRFSLTRLVRSSERERILGSWRERWNDFRGRA